MQREFMIDKITQTNGKSGEKVKYDCVTCDHEEPEMKINVTFEGDVPSRYKMAMGSTRLDTFSIEITSRTRQKTLE